MDAKGFNGMAGPSGKLAGGFVVRRRYAARTPPIALLPLGLGVVAANLSLGRQGVVIRAGLLVGGHPRVNGAAHGNQPRPAGRGWPL